MLDSLFEKFDNIIVLDVETTGVDCKRDEIIEIAMMQIIRKQCAPFIEEEFSALVKLAPNRELPAVISALTGITAKQLLEEGFPKDKVCSKLANMLQLSNLLLVAYNAQFDLCFLYYFLNSFGKGGVLKGVKMLDMLTVYKDRKPYPHKLSDAVNTYSLVTKNAHRALDDTRMTFELLCAMWKESDDIRQYINLFGYNPKYGVSGPKISSVKYMPQGYGPVKKLYET